MTCLDMTKWPAPVVRLYIGELTPAAVFAGANRAGDKLKRGQICEANGGEFTLWQGMRVEATRLLQLAVANCPQDSLNAPLRGPYSKRSAEIPEQGSSTTDYECITGWRASLA
jgi:hypothetical protein